LVEASEVNAPKVIFEAEFDDVHCFVIGVKHLMENKRAAARPQDLADVAALERRAALKR